MKDPSVACGDSSRVVETSVNFVSTFGAKSSVHSLLPEGNPLGGRLLSPPNPLRWASAGPPLGEASGAVLKVSPNRGDVGCADRGVIAVGASQMKTPSNFLLNFIPPLVFLPKIRYD